MTEVPRLPNMAAELPHGCPAATEQVFDFPIEQIDPVSARQAALAMLSRQSIAATDIRALSLDAARLAAKLLGTDAYAVAERIPERKELLLRFGRITGEGQSLAATEHRVSEYAGASLSGYALDAGSPVAVADLSTESRFADGWLLRQAIASAVVCPLLGAQGPVGTLGVYSTARRDFAPADVYFLESVANLLATARARVSAEELVAQKDSDLSAYLSASELPVVSLNVQGRIVSCNAALERLTGFTAAEISDRAFCSAFVLPEELDRVLAALTATQKGKQCVRLECYLLTKGGVRRRLLWSFYRTPPKDQAGAALICTGLDVTEQHELADRARRAEALADNALRSLRSLETRTKDEMTSPRVASIYADRRKRERRRFPYKQSIAPLVGEQQPTPDMFCEVRCRDVSASGFSFQSPSVPDYQQMLVAFGKEGKLIYVTAEIVHVTPLTENGQPLYVVGCRYTGRAEPLA